MPETTPKKLDLNRREMPKQNAGDPQPELLRSCAGLHPAAGHGRSAALPAVQETLLRGQLPGADRYPRVYCRGSPGRFSAGVRILKQKNSLPSVCGRVCPQEEQCEMNCALTKRGGQIAIGRMERFLGDWEGAQSEIELPGPGKSDRQKGSHRGRGPGRVDCCRRPGQAGTQGGHL